MVFVLGVSWGGCFGVARSSPVVKTEEMNEERRGREKDQKSPIVDLGISFTQHFVLQLWQNVQCCPPEASSAFPDSIMARSRRQGSFRGVREGILEKPWVFLGIWSKMRRWPSELGGAARRDDVPLCGEKLGSGTGTSGRHPGLSATAAMSVGIHSSEHGSGEPIPSLTFQLLALFGFILHRVKSP